MAQDTHINVTMDFNNIGCGVYDLRIPTQLTVKQLLYYVTDALHITLPEHSYYAIKVTTKKLFIADDDYIVNYPVTDGDILVVQ
ncbi:EsaB/YukD family protein [Virgibacillus dokdonensis]|uniref:YukD n=1 Tax=Virgibacillus dokdonensis TaxID=302167 RepID=A0A2K9J5B4_9BACI|nr:EsaB/YukD family protein [Virgibacillus dokdonensis]AUJ26915.1 YukD [Virgibacillus dokdonensis]